MRSGCSNSTQEANGASGLNFRVSDLLERRMIKLSDHFPGDSADDDIGGDIFRDNSPGSYY